MSKLLVVFGATGQQGGSIVDFVLNDPELSKQFEIRGISRDRNSSAAKALTAKGVEVVEADSNNPESLGAAVEGAHTVFSMTFPDFKDVKGSEVRQGKAVVDASIAAKAHYIIFSTLPNVTKLTGGKYTNVVSFDAKAEVEEYIRQQPIRSAFFAPGSFMQNYHSMMKPGKRDDGSFVIARPVSPKTQLPLIDTVGDTGKWIGAILADPEKFEDKTFCAATKLYTLEEQAAIMTSASGKVVQYTQIPEEVFKSFVPVPAIADTLVEMMYYQQDFGYYGSETEKLVADAAANARGKVTTFEEYLEKHPLQLD